MDEVMQGIPSNGDTLFGGDMIGNFSSERRGYEIIHGGYSFGEGNEAGERVLDFALFYDITVINTYLKEKEEYCITFKSGSNLSQIDYLMWKKERELSSIFKDCKVILNEGVITQHRLIVMEVW